MSNEDRYPVVSVDQTGSLHRRLLSVIIASTFVLLCLSPRITFCATSTSLPELISTIRGGVVGVGTVQVLRTPPASLRGTGFIVGNGTYVVTNDHVISVQPTQTVDNERLAVFVGRGTTAQSRYARKVLADPRHDLALLSIEGPALVPLRLAGAQLVREGEEVAFTGFPIGAALGLYPATHRGIVAAVAPLATPLPHSSKLSAQNIRALRDPFSIYQLDAVAYPGNSGSPVFLTTNGQVVGVVNKVFVKASKETLLTDPSGITYAIPIRYVHQLMRDAGIAAPPP